MRIALVAPPFISVPPKNYGGTELFVAHLALGIQRAGHDVVVYTVGDSTVSAERRWKYAKSEWPVSSPQAAQLRDLVHNAWAVQDAAADCDIVHVQCAPALAFSNSVPAPFVYTIHHSHEVPLSEFYDNFPAVQYVAISDMQKDLENLPLIETIHHGVDLSLYKLTEKKQDYLCFLGRFAPVKGAHLAIEVAKKAGIPLKMAGEIQPMYKSYFDAMIRPHIDGKFIEYLGEADVAMKNELLGGARALLFPIQWNEPFGLVMIESMACGTPVLALPGGSVAEVIKDGVSGWVCADLDEMAQRAKDLAFVPKLVRKYSGEFFSVDVMTRKYVDIYERLYAKAKLLDVADEIGPTVAMEDLSKEAAA